MTGDDRRRIANIAETLDERFGAFMRDFYADERINATEGEKVDLMILALARNTGVAVATKRLPRIAHLLTLGTAAEVMGKASGEASLAPAEREGFDFRAMMGGKL